MRQVSRAHKVAAQATLFFIEGLPEQEKQEFMNPRQIRGNKRLPIQPEARGSMWLIARLFRTVAGIAISRVGSSQVDNVRLVSPR